MTRAERQFYKFQGRKPKRKKYIVFEMPETLIHLANVTAIEYESDKKHGGGNGKKNIWRHDFKSKVKLCSDKNMDKIYLIGGKLKIKKSGITG